MTRAYGHHEERRALDRLRADVLYDTPACECVACCHGEHPGYCRECAGWGDRITDDGIVDCDYCAGTGICPKCDGACREDEE